MALLSYGPKWQLGDPNQVSKPCLKGWNWGWWPRCLKKIISQRGGELHQGAVNSSYLQNKQTKKSQLRDLEDGNNTHHPAKEITPSQAASIGRLLYGTSSIFLVHSSQFSHFFAWLLPLCPALSNATYLFFKLLCHLSKPGFPKAIYNPNHFLMLKYAWVMYCSLLFSGSCSTTPWVLWLVFNRAEEQLQIRMEQKISCSQHGTGETTTTKGSLKLHLPARHKIALQRRKTQEET